MCVLMWRLGPVFGRGAVACMWQRRAAMCHCMHLDLCRYLAAAALTSEANSGWCRCLYVAVARGRLRLFAPVTCAYVRPGWAARRPLHIARHRRCPATAVTTESVD